VRRRGLLLLWSLLAAVPARAEEPSAPETTHVLAGEVAVGGGLTWLGGDASTSGSLQVRSWDLRLGVGGRQRGASLAPLGAPPGDSATWLITAALSRGHTPAGLEVSGLRLGMGARYGHQRWTLGGDVELVKLEVRRVSTGGTLAATGLGVRLLGALDLLRFGADRAVLIYLDGALDELDPWGAKDFLPALHAGLSVRW
jgi:hypothetical protein